VSHRSRWIGTSARTPATVLARLIVAVSMVALLGGACATDREGDAANRSGDDSSVATERTDPADQRDAAPPTPTTDLDCPQPPVGTGREDDAPFAVGRSTDQFVDPSRPTGAPDAPGSSTDRVLPVAVLYPAQGPPGAAGSVVDGATPADGRFPLVVYAHGVGSSGAERHDALARWVRAGYVVVAPTFPLSSRGLDISDLPSQPGDLAFVVESVRDRVQDPSDMLHDHVRSDCLALAGHSLGGATALAAAFDPCCTSIGTDAVIDIAGVAVLVTPGATLGAAAPLPTLIVHGSLDATVPAAQSDRAFAELPGRRWLLTFPGGGHNSMFDPPELDVLTASVVGFLDAQLKGVPDAMARASSVIVDSGGLATLREAPA